MFNYKFWLGLTMCISGVLLGLYVGFWLLCVGGIMQIASNINPIDYVQIAWGLIKFFSASLFGYLSGFVLFLPGAALIAES